MLWCFGQVMAIARADPRSETNERLQGILVPMPETGQREALTRSGEPIVRLDDHPLATGSPTD